MSAWSLAKKEEFVRFLETYTSGRLERHMAQMAELNASLANESKSSAGDKYETSREMINQQINQIAQQINVTRSIQNLLPKIDFAEKEMLQPGAVFKAGNKLFSWSVSLGKVEFEGESILCISSQSPFAQTCLDAKVGDAVGMPQNQLKLAWVR